MVLQQIQQALDANATTLSLDHMGLTRVPGAVYDYEGLRVLRLSQNYLVT